MAMTEKTCDRLNHYVQALFAGNAKIDNLYYNLKYAGYNKLADAIHEPVAHVMGEFADRITDMMDKNDVRPIRLGLQDEIKEYSVAECFEELSKYFDMLVKITYQLIDDADMEDDYEVRIFMEDFLNTHVMTYRKQAHEWLNASKQLDANTFNIHVADYTHYIKL